MKKNAEEYVEDFVAAVNEGEMINDQQEEVGTDEPRRNKCSDGKKGKHSKRKKIGIVKKLRKPLQIIGLVVLGYMAGSTVQMIVDGKKSKKRKEDEYYISAEDLTAIGTDEEDDEDKDVELVEF